MTQAKVEVRADEANVDFFLRKVTPFDKDGVPGVVQYILGNGQVVKIEVAKLPEAMKERLMYHGLSQKVGDPTSGFSKGKDFAGAFEAMVATMEHLYEGKWNRGPSERSTNLNDLAEVIAKLKKFKVEDVLKTLQGMTEDRLKEMAKKAPIAAGLNDLRHARRQAALKAAAKGVEFDFKI